VADGAVGGISRRAFLAGTAGAAGLLATGCGAADVLGLRDPVRIAVSWSAAELQAFNAVLAGLGPLSYDVEVVPLGDDIGAAFGPRIPQRPDIVMMPQPGTVLANATRVAPLDMPPDWPYADVWKPLWKNAPPGKTLGLPFKMANESTVWYRRSVLAAAGFRSPPQTWSEWLAANRALLARRVAPLAVAAADGWMLTQTFDNVLLRTAPDAHRALVEGKLRWTDQGVQRAFRVLGRMWAEPGVLAGGVDGSLVQQFPDAVVSVFAHHRAAMVVAPDFAEGVIRRFATDPDDVGTFSFPTLDDDGYDPPPVGAHDPPVVIGGDIAVLAAPAGDQAVDLVHRLARPDAPQPWIERYGGFIAANRRYLGPYSPALTALSSPLGRSALVFDLSDDLGALGGREGLWGVMQDFLKSVGGRGADAVPAAALAAARTMDELAGRR
jgi:alpha-glucoside transport system substrate-binding protein